MAPGLIYDHPLEYLYTLVIDILVCTVKSFYFLLETIFLTLLPDRLRKKKDVTGQIVLITGGGGGVGRQIALNFARLNARVVIWDVNREAINATADALKTEGFECAGYIVDISDRTKVYEAAKKVKEEIGKVDILVNNAGIVTCRTFLDLPDKAIESTYAVNILSHYWTAKAFLPDMIADQRGHIVTVSSVTGLMGTYACTDYSATKFATVGFHESLYSELRYHGHDFIGMTLVCPYYINTGMFSGVKPRLFPMLEPKYVADRLVEATLKNEINCTLPASVRLMLPLKCLLPAKTCWEMMVRIMKGPQSMSMYKGRGKSKTG